jgi:hypothetical protein
MLIQIKFPHATLRHTVSSVFELRKTPKSNP